MAFGFLGALVNIPVLSKVSRVLGRADVTLQVCSPWVTPILVDTDPGHRGWDQTEKVTVVSPHPPGMLCRIFLLIRICACCSSCRRWETAAPWCDLWDGPCGWRWDITSEPWVRLFCGELSPLSATGHSGLARATPTMGTVPRWPSCEQSLSKAPGTERGARQASGIISVILFFLSPPVERFN